MPVDIRIETDTRGFKRLKRAYPKQVAFSTSLAINLTLKDIQRAYRRVFPKKVNIRRPGFAKRSVKVTQWAKKRDLEGIIGLIPPGGARADFWAIHETGGVKRPRSSVHLAIPTEDVWPNTGRVIPRSKRPENLKRSFKVRTRSGQDLILQRKGKRRVIVPYVLEFSARISPSLDWAKTSIGVVTNRFDRNFTTAFKKAIATAKR